MSCYDDVAMDFGDDDDGDDFLTGKLAALGIDEDLELSGGEEENEDPVAIAVTSTPAVRGAVSSSPPAIPSPPSPTAGDTVEVTAATPTEDGPPLATIGGDGEGHGAVEDGELLDLLQKPLQASRSRSQQHGSRDIRDRSRGGGEAGERKGGGHKGGSRGRPKGSNNGRVRGRNVTIKECAKWVCERLGEPKYYLMCRVVSTIGYTKTRRLLEDVQETQDTGGMPTADGSRKRTAGGVFFTLLKEHMDPAKLKELYADEIRVKKEKDRARRAALKRRAEAALAGEDVMTPRDPPRQRRRGRGSAGAGAGDNTEGTDGNARAWSDSGR